MLLLWTGVASAEGDGPEAVPSATGCDSIPLLPDCQPQRETTPEPPAPPAHSVDEQLEASEAIPAYTGPQALTEQRSSEPVASTETGGGESGAGGPSAQQAPAPPGGGGGGAPDFEAVGECIGEELALLVEGLQESLDEGAAELQAAIEEGLDPDNLANLPTFLEGLPALIESSAPGLAAEFEELLPGVAEGIAACLEGLRPPAEEEPKPTPPQEQPKPVTQPAATHYANCDDARARGAAPVYAGQPGYGSHLDHDNDGVGCEQETALVSHTPTAAPKLAYTGFEAEPFIVAGAALVALGTLTVIGVARRES
ncbi:hypothetical protein DQ244_00165 [Blastococcus sp. TBT05-19]|nr:hypothetical protein DQ244_00165 [Blastococcus sp. TBT05-19]